jgi:hypothetical protein
VLIELAMMERIAMPEKPGRSRRGMSKVGWSTAKVTVLDGPVVDDPLLATALAAIAERPRYAAQLIGQLGKGTKDALLERLSQRELVRPVEDKVWGLFPRTTWPAIERTHEPAVREQVHGVLVLSPDERTSVIISLLSGMITLSTASYAVNSRFARSSDGLRMSHAHAWPGPSTIRPTQDGL